VPLDEVTIAAVTSLMPEGDWVARLATPGGGPQLERLREIAAPDLEVEMIGPGGAFRQSFHGIDGFRDAWADWLEPYESYRIEPEDWRYAEDRIVFIGRQTAVPKGGGAEVESDAAAVLFFDEGLLKRIEFHLDRAAALRSAGLE
jgi:hypothetical protein